MSENTNIAHTPQFQMLGVPASLSPVYTNTCRFGVSPYEFTLVFGRQSDAQFPGSPAPVMVDGSIVIMSLPFLKILAVHLSHIVSELEAERPILVPAAALEGVQKQAAALAKGIRDAHLQP
jgi:hypothetical protein